MMMSSQVDMKRELERKIESDLVEVGVYVVFRRELQHRVLGEMGGDGSGSSIKSRASLREGGMGYLTAMSAAENCVSVSTNEYSLEADCWSQNVELHHKDC